MKCILDVIPKELPPEELVTFFDEDGGIREFRCQPIIIVESCDNTDVTKTEIRVTKLYEFDGDLVARCETRTIAGKERLIDEEIWYDAKGRRHRLNGAAVSRSSAPAGHDDARIDEVTEYWVNGEQIEIAHQAYPDVGSSRDVIGGG